MKAFWIVIAVISVCVITAHGDDNPGDGKDNKSTITSVRNFTMDETDLCEKLSGGKTLDMDILPPKNDTNSWGFITSRLDGQYSDDMTCNVNFNPPEGFAMVVSIRMMDLRPNCTDSLVFEYQSPGEKVATLSICNNGSYQNMTMDDDEKISYVSNTTFNIAFLTASITPEQLNPNETYEGFQLTYTLAAMRETCEDYEFKCSNDLCIQNELRCDGHNHCGDSSDQKDCEKKKPDDEDKGLSGGQIAGIIIGVSVAAGIVVGAVIIVQRKRKPGYDEA